MRHVMRRHWQKRRRALEPCFAIALAAEQGAVLLTGDPEILYRARELPCDAKDLRGSKD